MDDKTTHENTHSKKKIKDWETKLPKTVKLIRNESQPIKEEQKIIIKIKKIDKGKIKAHKIKT